MSFLRISVLISNRERLQWQQIIFMWICRLEKQTRVCSGSNDIESLLKIHCTHSIQTALVNRLVLAGPRFNRGFDSPCSTPMSVRIKSLNSDLIRIKQTELLNHCNSMHCVCSKVDNKKTPIIIISLCDRDNSHEQVSQTANS